ncbi:MULTISPECIES: hypothetical protein [unclassified Rhizobium]|uniref:hypothetical protein n=1 Tax=unclassified Rhizobium TaxID=2613769 RepID=UPI003D29BE40
MAVTALAVATTRPPPLALADGAIVLSGVGALRIAGLRRFRSTRSRVGGRLFAAPLRLSATAGLATRSPCC